MSGAAAALLAAICLATVFILPAPSSGPGRTLPSRPPDVGRCRGQGSPSAALVADAAAALLRSGASVPLTLTHLGAAHGPAPELAIVARMLAWGAEPRQAWAVAPSYKGLREALALAEGTGAPVSVVLSRRALEQRRGRARDEEARAAALAVRLVLPMGLCGLPAFICLGIVPIGLALMPW
ncbi:MAG: type II secretion system F family protein [Galactobacter sp.]